MLSLVDRLKTAVQDSIAVGYFFHLDELKDYINTHSEIKIHNWFDACIKVVTPVILVYLLADQFITNVSGPYGGYDKVLAHSVTIAGWGWFVLILVIALLLSRHYLAVRRILFRHGYRLAANYCVDDFYYHPSIAYRPRLSTRLTTGARRIAHEFYDREPALTARRLARVLKNRS